MKLFEEYIEQRSVSIKRNWKKYLEGKDPERLHQMRVEVKKLRAMLHFIGEMEKEFDLHKRDKLPQHLLGISGDLRDHYNFHLLAEKLHFKIPSLQIQMEQYEYQQAFQKLQLYYRKHHAALSQLKKEMDKYLAHLTTGQLEEYVADLAKKIIVRMEKGLVKDDLHELRKKMKEFVYLYKLLDRKGEQIFASAGADRMNELQDLIGRWHDMKKFETKIKDLKSARPVKKISDTIHEEEKKLFDEIFNLSQLVLAETSESIPV